MPFASAHVRPQIRVAQDKAAGPGGGEAIYCTTVDQPPWHGDSRLLEIRISGSASRHTVRPLGHSNELDK